MSGSMVQQRSEMSVYLDHNATTALRPEAAAAMAAAIGNTGNPSSVHRHGRHARRLIEDAREQVAAAVGTAPARVVFTSGGTEANALAVRGTRRRRILVSAVEHLSVLRAAERAEVIPVDGDGVVRLDALEAMLAAAASPALVSVMLANNETGVLQPVAEVAAIARRFGALVHCDAAQAVGRIAVDASALGADLLSFSAHKLGGPAGVGALVVDPAVPLAAQLTGGGQERGRRAGTENTIGIAGFGAAAAAAADRSDVLRLGHLRDRLERSLHAACPAMQVFGAGAARLPNTSCLAMPGVDSETQVITFDLEGVCISAGSACSSGKVTRSHVLDAMGVGGEIAGSAVRVSLGWTTGERDVERFIEVWTSVYARMQARRPSPAALQVAAARPRVMSER